MSIINYQSAAVDRLILPKGISLASVPNLPLTKGSVAYNVTDDKVYYSNGSSWAILGASGAITVNSVTLTNSTPGYVPTALNYYEEATVNTTWGGPWANQNVTLKFVRIGKAVTMSFSVIDVAVTAAGNAIQSTAPIPDRFFPAQLTTSIIEVVDGVNNAAKKNGTFQLNTTGDVFITSNNRATFSSTYAGVSGGSICWLVA